MAPRLYLSILALCSVIAYFVASKVLGRFRYSRRSKEAGCLEPPSYPHRDPILGLDLLSIDNKATEEGRVFSLTKELFAKYGKTYKVNFLGTRLIRTMDKLNIQSVLATDFQSFGLEPLREGIARPFFDRGINTTDGEFWQYSRALVKPTFSRSEICRTDILEKHFNRLLDHIPEHGFKVDLQPLFSRLFLDSSTEFLFGKSTNCLTKTPPTESEEFIEAFEQAMFGLGRNVRMGKLRVFNYDRKWFKAIRIVHKFIDARIDEAIDNAEKFESEETKPNDELKRYILLHEMARMTQSKDELRSQILSVFMPSRDTIAWLVSNVFHALARQPTIWNRLREEVLAVGDAPLTFETLKSIKYLQWVLNESHRIYPVTHLLPRSCLRDTVLPTGGGSDGKSPVYVQKGDLIFAYIYNLHQDKDLWTDDAEEFKPDRWKNLKPVWDFIPFGGGPRNCPAQQLVLTEAAFFIARMAQQFSAIESRDAEPWTELWGLGPKSKHGVQVALTPS